MSMYYPHLLAKNRIVGTGTCKKTYEPLIKDKKLGKGAYGAVYKLCEPDDRDDCPYVTKESILKKREERLAYNNEVRALRLLKGKTVTYKGQTWKIAPQIKSHGECDGVAYIEMENLYKPKFSKSFMDKARAVLEKALDLGCAHVDTHDGNWMADDDNNPVLIDWGWGWCKQWGKITKDNYPVKQLKNFDALVDNTWANFNEYA